MVAVTDHSRDSGKLVLLLYFCSAYRGRRRAISSRNMQEALQQLWYLIAYRDRVHAFLLSCQARTAEGPDLQRQVRTLMSLPSSKNSPPRMRTDCDPCLQSQDAPQERINTDQFGLEHHFYQDSARLSKIQSRGRAEKVFVLENPSTYISKRVCRSLVAVRPARLRSHPRVAELRWRLTLYAPHDNRADTAC